MTLILKRFVAGVLATLVFHQAAIAMFWLAKLSPRTPFAMDPVSPLGVPAIISLAFWGGVWGLALLWLIARLRPRWRLLAAIVLGAFGPTLVYFFVVAPLKGGATPPAALFVGGLLVNALWGFGAWLFARLLLGKHFR